MMKVLHYLKMKKLRYLAFIFPACALALVFFYPEIGFAASVSEVVNQIMGGIIGGIVSILGKILIVVINVLIWVAQYNDFINAKAIDNGWGILRDLCNMFFILILLVIAFATTLNRESYSMKRLLPKFIIAAVLINFSKLICGVIIDFAQVIMLTFVNGFRDIGGGNLADMLGITELLSADLSNAEAVNTFAILGSYLLALLYVIVAGAVLVVMLFLLIMRIVMIWMYVVLSPLPYLLMILPATQKYADQWWKQFIEAVATGPILAFFIWLSFASATIGSSGQDVIGVAPNSSSENEQKYLDSLNTSAGLTKAGSADGMLKFVISIGLLMGGIIITKQAGGAVGQMAGRLSDKIQKGGINIARGGAKMAGQAAGRTVLNTAKATGRGALNLGGKGLGAVGTKLSSQGYKGLGARFSGAGKFATDWRDDLKKTRDEVKSKKRQKTLEKLGIKEKGQKSLQDLTKTSPIMGKMLANTLAGSPGAALMTPVAAGAGWAGGLAKNWMSNWQRKADVKKTGKTVDKLENKVSDAYKQRSRATGMLDQEEKKEKDKLQKQWDDDKNNPLIKYNVDQKYQKEMDRVTERYQQERDYAEATYNKTATPEQKRDDANNAANLETAKRHHEEAKLMATYLEKKTETKAVKKDYKDKTRDLENNRNLEIRNAQVNFKGNALDSELKRINAKYEPQADSLRKSHETDLEAINNKYKPLENIQTRGPLRRPINWGGKKAQDWNPSSMTDLALKKGTKEFNDAKNVIAALATEKIGDFKKDNFTSAAANSGTHNKLFEGLASGTPEAKAGLTGLLNELKKVNANATGATDKEKPIIQGIKQGLARYLKDKGEDRGAFQDVISELDKIHTGDDKRIKVDDYTPKTD